MSPDDFTACHIYLLVSGLKSLANRERLFARIEADQREPQSLIRSSQQMHKVLTR
jgi:hypothetical protein